MGTDDIVPSVPQGGGSPLPFSVRPDRFNPASMAEAARAIEALLTEHGVQLSPGSWMGRAIAETAVRLPEEVRHDFPVPPDAAAQRQRLGRLRKAGDLLLLSKALESARGTLSIADLRRSLKVLAGGFHELTAKTQQSRERDLAFELMVAGWVGKYSTDVTLVEPDIVCRFEDTVSPEDAQSIRACRLEVDLDEIEPELAVVVRRVRRQIEGRLGLPPNRGAAASERAGGVDFEEELPEDPEVSPEEEALEEAVGGDNAEIELGRSLLHALLGNLDNADWCAAQADALKDIAKPATIIDGQHRVKGAEACERRIPFAVCALVDCAWAEQVFQFTVVNYTAKGIPDQFITANAALSLTTHELETLQTRLVQAGVKVVEYELMKVVHFEAESPFFELVNLTEKKQSSRIGYKTMVRVARAWYHAEHPSLKLLLTYLYPEIRGAYAKRRRMERWKEGDWGAFFLDFWTTVRAHLGGKPSHEAGHTLWDVGHSNLMVAIVLLRMQEQFFANLDAQDEEFFIPKESSHPLEELRTKIRRRAERFVEWIPPGFLGTKWALTSLSTGAGREALDGALRRLVETKGAYQYEKSTLITGKTT